MRTKIFGRDSELKDLKEKYDSKKAELVVLYGRRRVGKSFLIKNFMEPRPHLCFEGLEKERRKIQIEHFVHQLKKQIPDKLLQKVHFDNWEDVFDYLTDYLQRQNDKIIIFFDEFQWMSSGQGHLVALLKYYWDNRWRELPVMLILCGSIASFMVKKVIRSKALYGRTTLQMHIRKLDPLSCQKLMGLDSDYDTLRFWRYLIFS